MPLSFLPFTFTTTIIAMTVASDFPWEPLDTKFSVENTAKTLFILALVKQIALVRRTFGIARRIPALCTDAAIVSQVNSSAHRGHFV